MAQVEGGGGRHEQRWRCDDEWFAALHVTYIIGLATIGQYHVRYIMGLATIIGQRSFAGSFCVKLLVTHNCSQEVILYNS